MHIYSNSRPYNHFFQVCKITTWNFVIIIIKIPILDYTHSIMFISAQQSRGVQKITEVKDQKQISIFLIFSVSLNSSLDQIFIDLWHPVASAAHLLIFVLLKLFDGCRSICSDGHRLKCLLTNRFPSVPYIYLLKFFLEQENTKKKIFVRNTSKSKFGFM